MLTNKTAKPSVHQIYMRRCLQLAFNGRGSVSPNPMVGAVVVYGDKIIGEGWHQKAGDPHAEPNAIRSVKHQEWLKESCLYVSLEPCSHHGKTPPCADLIIEKQIPKVVIGCADPFPAVSGRGIQKLREAGVEVICDVEKEACLMMNRVFFRVHLSHRPYIILKWAETTDGFIDQERCLDDGASAWKISDSFTQLWVHKLRSQADAVLVGSQTALLDHPRLNVRHWPSRQQPLALVADRRGRCRGSLLERLNGASIDELMQQLYQRQIQSVVVEGGAQLHQAFLEADLWDEIQVEHSPTPLGKGIRAATLPAICSSHQLLHQRIDCSRPTHYIDSYIRRCDP